MRAFDRAIAEQNKTIMNPDTSMTGMTIAKVIKTNLEDVHYELEKELYVVSEAISDVLAAFDKYSVANSLSQTAEAYMALAEAIEELNKTDV